VQVTDLCDSGEVTTVYNVRVADFHTYFVGSEEWGFALWAHNDYSISAQDQNQQEINQIRGDAKNGNIQSLSQAGQPTAQRPGGYHTYDVDQYGRLSLQANRAPGSTNSAEDLFVQAHHPIQNEWAKRNVEGYNENEAPAMLLPSASGLPHALISAAQRARRATEGGYDTTIQQEFNISYREMLVAGVPQAVARQAIKQAYKYFASIGAFE
jgi:hypothetical protein